MQYQPIIGLEIHAELKTKTKMFCDSLNDPNERHPNVDICPVCVGHPGVLPVINKDAVKKVIKTGLALNCDISRDSKFDRKNYFYPDLPKGYQISQYDQPLCKQGFLEMGGKKIRIRRIHLEEDTGKLMHPEGADYSLVDFNRAGVPLMELVTEPDIRTGQEARQFAEELRLIFRYLGVSDADMEKGQMRVEVNISLLPTNKDISEIKSEKDLGTKVEIKNLNSFRAVGGAVEHEIKRQSELLDGGEKIIQETRGWNENKGVTVSQREKEEAHDYRYFPEPDLPPLHFTKKEIEEIRLEVPELPQQKRQRFASQFELQDKEVEIFIQDSKVGDYFEKVMSELRNWMKDEKIPEDKFPEIFRLCANYITSDLLGLVKKALLPIEELLITPENFAEFVVLIYEGKISSKAAKQVLEEMFGKGGDPSHIVKEKGLVQVSDEKEIEKIIEEIMKDNPGPVGDYQKGKENALQFLAGKVMAVTKGTANPKIVQEILREKLKG